MGMYPAGNVITLTPAVLTAAYADDEVGLDSVEIPNAVSNRGGVSRLTGITMVCKDAGLAPDGEMYFHTNDQSWGTAGAAVTITDAQMFDAGILGWVLCDGNDWKTNSSTSDSAAFVFTLNAKENDPHTFKSFLLKAAEGSTSVYFSFHPNVAWDFESTSDLQISFHIEYLG